MSKSGALSATIVICLLTLTPGFGAWEQKADLPFDVGEGGALSTNDWYVVPGGRLWAICGDNENGFCYYDAASDLWTDMSATVPEDVVFSGGACLSFVLGQSGKLLILTGNDEAFIFHKYFVYKARGQIGLFPNFWQQFALPSDDMGSGAALTSEATSPGPPDAVTNVYAFEGNSNQGFFRTTLSYPVGISGDDGIIRAYPPENAVVGTSAVTIDWTDVVPGDGYEMQISRNSTFTDLVADEVLSQGEFLSSSLPDRGYLWRVRFKRGESFLGWTLPVPFVVNTTRPKPAEGAFLTTPYPTFAWMPSPQAVCYHMSRSPATPASET
jgi:hypothetical protein